MSNTSVEAAIGGSVGGFVSVLTTNALTWVSHRLQLTQGKAEKTSKNLRKNYLTDSKDLNMKWMN